MSPESRFHAKILWRDLPNSVAREGGTRVSCLFVPQQQRVRRKKEQNPRSQQQRRRRAISYDILLFCFPRTAASCLASSPRGGKSLLCVIDSARGESRELFFFAFSSLFGRSNCCNSSLVLGLKGHGIYAVREIPFPLLGITTNLVMWWPLNQAGCAKQNETTL